MPLRSDVVEHGGLRVFVDVLEDDERRDVRALLGIDVNLTLLFTPYGPDELFLAGQLAMLRAVVALGERGVRGALYGDLGADESLVLRLDESGLVLNASWPGWQEPPELRSALPADHRIEPLGFSRG